MKANLSLPSTDPEPHTLERDVRRELLSHPELHFDSLVVRRVDRGVCLEGVLHVERDGPDVEVLLRRVCGVTAVLNHLVVQPEPPAG